MHMTCLLLKLEPLLILLCFNCYYCTVIEHVLLLHTYIMYESNYIVMYFTNTATTYVGPCQSTVLMRSAINWH